jgi:KipI family sensor histidine kinase inhibitor
MDPFSLHPYSERGWLLGIGGAAQRLALLAALECAPPAGLAEYVPGFGNVLLLFAEPLAREDIERWLVRQEPQVFREAPAVHHRIPVRYDGPDLAEVARAIGASVEEVIGLHSAQPYEVMLLGFSPGFPYLGPLHPRLHLPRRESPRTRVPAGAVAIGGSHAGIYPAVSPGGWHLLGTTDFVLFRPQMAGLAAPSAREVFTLAPGDRVSFVPIP